MKKLTELPLDELWQLFPITLTAHQEYWADWYKEEAELLTGKAYHRYTCGNSKRRENLRFESHN